MYLRDYIHKLRKTKEKVALTRLLSFFSRLKMKITQSGQGQVSLTISETRKNYLKLKKIAKLCEYKIQKLTT